MRRVEFKPVRTLPNLITYLGYKNTITSNHNPPTNKLPSPKINFPMLELIYLNTYVTIVSKFHHFLKFPAIRRPCLAPFPMFLSFSLFSLSLLPSPVFPPDQLRDSRPQLYPLQLQITVTTRGGISSGLSMQSWGATSAASPS